MCIVQCVSQKKIYIYYCNLYTLCEHDAVCEEYIGLCEEYIGLMPVAQTNPDTIVVCIKDVLLRMNH